MTDFRVGSFNAYNLVRPGVRYYNQKAYGEQEFDEKTDWIAGMLKRMDAHIVGFQEIFHRSALQAATEKSGLFENADWVVAPMATEEENEADGKAKGPKVGLATRFELKTTESFIDFPEEAQIKVSLLDADGTETMVENPVKQFQRPPLKAVVELPTGDEVVVFVAHLKSKRPIYLEGEDSKNLLHRALGSTRALLVRSSEAAALRALILEEVTKTDQPVIVLGDLNDSLGAVSTQVVAGDPPFHRLSFKHKLPIWDALLYSTNDIQARQSTRGDAGFTHVFNGRYEILDHIFVSQEFYRRNPRRIGHVLYQHIFNDHIVDETLVHRERSPITSDHGIPLADVKLIVEDD